jgi:thioredoxin-like negative regulator of GroEL
LEQNKLTAPVLLDARREVAGLYQVQSIPHTVLIGADGRVQVVHIGYHPNLTKILSNDIEAVLAGKDMASETLRRADEAARKNSQSGKASSDQPGVKGVPTTPQN